MSKFALKLFVISLLGMVADRSFALEHNLWNTAAGANKHAVTPRYLAHFLPLRVAKQPLLQPVFSPILVERSLQFYYKVHGWNASADCASQYVVGRSPRSLESLRRPTLPAACFYAPSSDGSFLDDNSDSCSSSASEYTHSLHSDNTTGSCSNF